MFVHTGRRLKLAAGSKNVDGTSVPVAVFSSTRFHAYDEPPQRSTGKWKCMNAPQSGLESQASLFQAGAKVPLPLHDDVRNSPPECSSKSRAVNRATQ